MARKTAITVSLTQEQIAWVEEYDGSMSAAVREALDNHAELE
jgi:Arc/MetJ-type ribon-helix-helix transcriptional regulator